MSEDKFRSHPELVKGIRIQYSDRDSKTRTAVIHSRTGNFITVHDALKQRHRIRLSEVRGYWIPRVKSSPANMITVG